MWPPHINEIFCAKSALSQKCKSNLTKLTPPRAHVKFSVFRELDKLFTAFSKSYLPDYARINRLQSQHKVEKLFWLSL